MAKKMGRPPKDSTGPKREWLQIRIETSEKDKMKAAAKKAGLSMSDWARGVLIRSANRK